MISYSVVCSTTFRRAALLDIKNVMGTISKTEAIELASLETETQSFYNKNNNMKEFLDVQPNPFTRGSTIL